MTKKYRDSLFRDYFNDKIRLLSLCNALLDTDYTNSEDIVINTLEGVFFSEVKNDLSCLIQNRLIVIIEHQSTVNENMPLRMLFYVNELFRQFIANKKQSLYKTKLIPLPKPEFFVIYNGKKKELETRTLKLSEAFDIVNSPLELEVTLYNVNDFQNEAMVRKSVHLTDYCLFVENVNIREASGMSRKEAIEETIDYCIANNIMRDYLIAKRKEVFKMVDFEFNLEEAREAWRQEAEEIGEARGLAKGEARGLAEGEARGLAEGEARGLAKGEAKGKTEERLSSIRNIMQTLNLTVQQAMDALKIPPEEQAAYASKV